MGANGGNVPVEFAAGPNDQNYVQATFPFINIYLGVLMVYNATFMRQDVHCRLTWSRDTKVWNSVDQARQLRHHFGPCLALFQAPHRPPPRRVMCSASYLIGC